MMKNSFICVLLAIAFVSCKKAPKLPEQPPEINTEITDGLPADISLLNGYFKTTRRLDSYGVLMAYDAYATFKDPGASLMLNHDKNTGMETSAFTVSGSSITAASYLGNVNVGQVLINGVALSVDKTANRISYQHTSSSYTSATALTWTTDGNGPFKPIRITLPRSAPTFTPPPAAGFTISTSGDLVVGTSTLASNYDSLIVMIGNPNTLIFEQMGFARIAVSPGKTSIIFSKEQLQGISYPNIIYFFACNYSHITLGGKIYLFEQMSRFGQYIYSTP